MIEIEGAYSTAKIFTETIDETTATQIKLLCDQEFCSGTKIRVMPDVHAGIGCVIGFTANLGDVVIPNIVGVDIGCGMLTVELGKLELDFTYLDNVIRKYVPSGKDINVSVISNYPALFDLYCHQKLKNTSRIERSIGTLGGGNHFIEIDIDDEDNKYLIIHTGSRNLGKQVADYYQNLAFEILSGKDKLFEERESLIKKYKEQGRQDEIQTAIKQLEKEYATKTVTIPKEFCYLTQKYRDMYLHDMKICQEFATLNRKTIAEVILEKLFDKHLDDFTHFETVHNYIDLENNMVRKGAVSAQKNEKLIIPINMRDGSLICIGKGNEDWNYSSPHGAGRLYSRLVSRNKFTLSEFEQSMESIYTTSINYRTLDECPMAYKDMSDIVKNIGPTAKIIKHIKPLYNFKASD